MEREWSVRGCEDVRGCEGGVMRGCDEGWGL